MAITHGVSASKQSTSVSTPVVADSGIIFVVGTAPVHTVNGKVNEVIMAQSYAEAVEQLGYSEDWEKYSICEVIYTAFQLYQVSPLFIVNVLDPAKHKTAVAAQQMEADESNQILLPLEAIADTVEITDRVTGTDFDVFYNDDNCVIEFTEAQTGAVEVKYSVVDPSQVDRDDIIGGYSVTDHKSTGFELIDSVFPKYTQVPDLILCPNWSHDPEVAAVMSAKAENINGLFEAMAILDIDTTQDGVTYYGDAPAWKKQKNYTKPTEIVCFPKVALGDRVYNFSTQLAGIMSATDNNEDLGGGTPCESASNKSLQADRMVLADGTEVVLDLQNANYLNENGIVTALNFYNGFVSWGNYTACYPSNTDVADYFYCVNRMFRWVAKCCILSYWSYVDRKLTRRLIDAILQGINDWLNGLTAEERILGGRVEMLDDENTTTALMSGHVKFHIYITPPSPLQQIEFVEEYDLSYLEALLS